MNLKLHMHLMERHGVDGGTMALMSEQAMIRMHFNAHHDREQPANHTHEDTERQRIGTPMSPVVENDSPEPTFQRITEWMAQQDTKDGQYAAMYVSVKNGQWNVALSVIKEDDSEDSEDWTTAVSHGVGRKLSQVLATVTEEFRISEQG